MKTIIMIIGLLLCGQVYPADILETMTDYRHAVRNDLDVDTASADYMSDTRLDQIIRGAIVDIMPRLRVRSEDTILTTRNTFRYALDTTCLSVVGVEWKKVDSLKSMVFVKRGKWYEQEHRTTSGTFDPYKRRPSFWDSDDDYLYLGPTPSINNDTLLIQYIRKVPSIATVTDLSIIPQVYRPAIQAWATYKVAMIKGDARVDVFLRDLEMIINWAYAIQIRGRS